MDRMNKSRVVVGLSGGVDSSTAAALLKKDGYDVIGVFVLGWTGSADFPCSWQEEEADAKAAADHLGIPFYTVNLTKEYEEGVIQDFLKNYQAGLTPNPDVLCNKEVKFKALWQAVRQFEPDYLATGHYAQIKNVEGSSGLYKGVDSEKDQSYFLWNIDQAMLPKILFPLGGMTKTEVRAQAKAFGLPTANKKDSQGVCFIGSLKVREFLRHHLRLEVGEAVTTDGHIVAGHQGVQLYTVGQRLAAGSVDWTGDVPPLYVVAKDIKHNRLLVGSDEQTYADQLTAATPNWLTKPPHQTFVCQTKIRYRQKDVSATVAKLDNQIVVNFTEPVRAITPGQSIVFYANDGQLLGGAVITNVPAQEHCLTTIRSH